MPTPTKRLRHPYHLKKAYIHWPLRLLKHEHTGRRVHHQHTSYPVLGLLLLSVGVVLVQSGSSAHAAITATDSLVVSAVVSGPVPTAAATITAPAEGTDFTAAPIAVTGTCPLDTYVRLFRNNVASGTALCTHTGTYTISTDLFKGTNQLIAKVYNYANEAGPNSDPRTVTYTPPAPVIPPVQGSNNGPSSGGSSNGNTGGTSSGSGTSPAPAIPLLLKDDFTFRGFTVNEAASWRIAISGGSVPYSISVDWGDGGSDLYTSTAADTLTLTHTYKKAAPDGGYAVIVSASDAAGNKTVLQLLALVTDVSSAGNATGSGSGTSAGGSAGTTTVLGMSVPHFIGYIWTTYSVLCVTLLSFWLGEVRELRLIRLRFKKSHV